MLFHFFFLTRPIFKAIKVAQELSDRNYGVKFTEVKRNDEIGRLNNSLYALKENLVILKSENDAFTDSLEDRINEVTAEIKQKNVLTNALLEISKVFLTASNTNGISQMNKSLDIICASLNLAGSSFVRIDSNKQVWQLSNCVEIDHPVKIEDINILKEESQKHGIISQDTRVNSQAQAIIEQLIIPESNFYYYSFISELGDENFIFVCESKR